MERLIKMYPDRVPVIVESKIKEGEKFKFMVPRDKTIREMLIKLRRHIKMSPKKAMFIFVNDTLPPNSYTVGQVWDDHKNADNVLHMYYSLENTFG
jgi:GABA(A) receptor-associated protein